MDDEISDGDLVRLAGADDPVAFRLLVERYRPAALARALRLCGDLDDVEDIVQDAFLQAFVALDRLQDPERFAAWLGGIVLNVYRASRRRQAPLALVAEWPEELHPVSADGLPEAAVDDLDRADVVGRALEGLPARQRQAVRMFYYADLPVAGIADRLADTPGAVKARLHQARRRLRGHLAARRPDLIPCLPQRTVMTTVRIAYAEPRPVKTRISHVLVVLADDAGGRALPLWLKGYDGHSLRLLLDRPPGGAGMAGVPEELTDQILRAAGVTVTGVDIDELGPQVTVARIELHGPTGTQHVTVRLGDGLALAVVQGAPIRVASTLMDRLAEPVQDGDLPGPFLDRVPSPTAASGAHARAGPGHGPRNLAFAEGLDGWDLNGSFFRDSTGSHWDDYYARATEDQGAALGAAVPEPYGFAALEQTIFADNYRGQTVSFRGELRADGIQDRAFAYLRIVVDGAVGGPARAPSGNKQVLTWVGDSQDWARHEATGPVPDDAVFVQFGIALAGQGRIELRNAGLVSERAR